MKIPEVEVVRLEEEVKFWRKQYVALMLRIRVESERKQSMVNLQPAWLQLNAIERRN